MGQNAAPTPLRSACSVPARSRNASAWNSSTEPDPTAMTSLWNTPASITAGDCCANTHRCGGRCRSFATRMLASSVCRAGCRVGCAPLPSARAPNTNRCTPVPSAAISRVWLAAPSSPNGPSHGSAACTLHRSASWNTARSVRSVWFASMRRCGMERRLATTRCMRASSVSVPGATVAALAVHMALALQHLASSSWLSRAAAANTASSLPAKPASRNSHIAGRSCGGRKPCGRPSAATASILASPCSAAARGRDTCLACRPLARLPSLSPA